MKSKRNDGYQSAGLFSRESLGDAFYKIFKGILPGFEGLKTDDVLALKEGKKDTFTLYFFGPD